MEITKVESPQDYEDALEVRHRVFVEEQMIPVELEKDEFEKESIHFLVRIDGKGVGTGRIRIVENFVKFERVAVLAEARGKGIGWALMKKMQEFVREKYSGYLPKMHAQVDSIGFYEKLGWIAVGERFIEGGIEHQEMAYELNS